MLYDPAQHMTYAITISAAEVWDWCDGTLAIPAMVDALARRYDAPVEVITADVAALIERLTNEGLLV